MLVGIPLISHQKNLDFRKFVNLSLDQHEHVGLTTIPLWKKSSSKGVMVKKSDIENPLLLVIKNDFNASIMSYKGTFYHVGKVDSECSCILIIHLCRDKQHSFMGGTITILDILYYDNENLIDVDYTKKMKQYRFLHNCIHLPKRYSFTCQLKKSDCTEMWSKL